MVKRNVEVVPEKTGRMTDCTRCVSGPEAEPSDRRHQTDRLGRLICA